MTYMLLVYEPVQLNSLTLQAIKQYCQYLLVAACCCRSAVSLLLL